MDFVANLVSKVGGDDALNMINDNLTPLLLKSFRPKISDYVGTHVERTRGELFQQLPDGVKNVLDDIIPGGLNPSQQRGIADGARGFFDEIGDQIRQKIGEILNETSQRVREIVQNVTSSTSDRVTNSVVDIAQNKLRLKTQRGIEENSRSGDQTRAFNFSGSNNGSGDFIDNFINSSLEEVRPLVRGELKSVYDHIIDLVPQDARKILVAIIPGLKDEQGNQGGNFNQSQGQNSQYQGQTNQNYNQPQNNYNNQYQGQDNQNFNQPPNNYNNQQGNFNQYQGQNNQNFNQGSSRGIETEDSEPRSRGFMSDLKNMAHQFKDTVKNELKIPHMGGGSRDGAQLLEEFQAKAKDKIGRITTELMNQLENKIMVTVSEELRSVAKSKLASSMSF